MYKCNVCDFNTKIKTNYELHNKTKKHLKKISAISENISEISEKISENISAISENISENISLEIQDIPEIEDKTFEYYQKYLAFYNELDEYRKNNRKAIHEGTSVWIQQMRELNIQFRECYFNYDLKRNYWKPIKSLCINQIKSYMREKQRLKWEKRSELRDNYIIIKVNGLVPYLLTDIRDFRSPIQ